MKKDVPYLIKGTSLGSVNSNGDGFFTITIDFWIT